jgi:hypothetical protein
VKCGVHLAAGTRCTVLRPISVETRIDVNYTLIQ